MANETRPAINDEFWHRQPAQLVGHILDGKFRLRSVIDSGGYAVMYRADGIEDGKQYAIKVLYIEPDEDAVDKIRRFIIEKQAYAELKDVDGFVSHVVHGRLPAKSPEQITDSLAKQYKRRMLRGTLYYLVMPYMPGRSLAERIRTRGKLPKYEAVSLLLEISRAIHRAHERGILHRDIKPANILFDQDNRPKIADLGTAYFAHTVERNLTRVRFGANYHVGSDGYMSPETHAGRGNTRRRDLYALGVVLIELLTGRIRLPRDTDADTWQKTIEQRANRLKDPQLKTIVFKTIAENPSDRYQSVRHFVQQLESFGRAKQATPSVRRRLRQHWRHLNRPQLSTGIANIKVAAAKIYRRFENDSLSRRQIQVALVQWIVLSFVFATWPDFYGAGRGIIPVLCALLSLFRPKEGTYVAAAVLSILLLALSPFLGLLSIGMFVVIAQQYNLSTHTLFNGWVWMLALPLSELQASLAIPLLFAMQYRDWKVGARYGLSTFMLISFWLILQGQQAQGSLLIIDPLEIGYSWFVDIKAYELFVPNSLLMWLRAIASGDAQPFQLGELLIRMWTETPIPIVQGLLWTATGALAGMVSLHIQKPETYTLPISIVAFCLTQMMLSSLFQVGEWVDIPLLLVGATLSAMVTSFLLSILKQGGISRVY